MALRPGGADDTAERIERLLSSQEPVIQRAFLIGIQTINGQLDLDTLEELIDQRRFSEVDTFILQGAQVFAASYGEVLLAAGSATAAFLSNSALLENVAFEVAALRVNAALASNTARLTNAFVQEQRQVVFDVLQDGFRRGINPRQSAREIKRSIGLTPFQERTVRNFRRLLSESRLDELPSREVFNRSLRDGRFDRTIERALREGNPLNSRQVDQMVDRYRERLVAHRATVIARTEALGSIHEGIEAMYEQAVRNGNLQADQIIRTWKTAEDERVRSSHRNLNGTQIGIGEVFQGFASPIRFPGDPEAAASERIQCRCIVTRRLRAEP